MGQRGLADPSRAGEFVSDSLPELLLVEGDSAARIDLAEALAKLKPAERALIISRFVDDLSVARTAELLGRTEGLGQSHHLADPGEARRRVCSLRDRRYGLHRRTPGACARRVEPDHASD